MGITVITLSLQERFARARRIIESIEEEMPPGMRREAWELAWRLSALEDKIVDGPSGERGAT